MTTLLRKHGRYTLQLALPVVFSQLGHVMVGVADSMMVGQLGKEPLAAAAFGNSLFGIFLVFGLGMSYAITPLIAKADGEGDLVRMRQVLKHGMVIMTISGLLLFLLMHAGRDMLHFMNQPEEVVILALPYFSIISASLIPLMFFQSIRQFLEGSSLTRPGMIITVSSNIINVILNYILIFGKLGFPALGLFGAGLSTFISRVLMALAAWAYLRYGERFSNIWEDFSFSTFKNKVFKEILNIGLPMGAQFTFEVTTFALAAIMMGWLGTVPLAAHQITINLASITYMAASGISSAATIRVGNQLGKKDFATMREVSFTCYELVMIFMLFCALLFIIGMNFLPKLYIDDPEVIALSSTLLIIAALFQLSDGAQVVGLGSLRGLTDVKIPTIITMIAYWVIGLPTGYLLGFTFGFGAIGIWVGLLAGLTIAAVLLYRRFNKVSQELMLQNLKTDQLKV